MHRTFACYHDVLVLQDLLQCLQMSQGMNVGNEVKTSLEFQKISCVALLFFCHIYEAAIAFEYVASQSNHLDLPFSLMNSLS